ncbi:hypothetical protein B0H11DRAFT_2294178 [Mycena galericulata]|nr:hypothetical protein B0H11DRAFT_2294178 [Mycena galericulata]
MLSRPLNRTARLERPPALTGPLEEIYDPKNKTLMLGQSFVAEWVLKKDWARIVRPLLPEGDLLLYHQLWRALLRGSEPFPWASGHSNHPGPGAEETRTARPALPVELVRLIIRTAGLMVPNRQQTKRADRSVFVRVTTRDEAPVVSRVWFWTHPLDLAKVAAVQLVTLSRDQGWVAPLTDVCHSWFEWGVVNGGVPPQDVGGDITGNEGAWRAGREKQTEGKTSENESVWRRTHGNPVADSRYLQHDGPRVGMDDSFWDGAKAGSALVVRACAQQAMWENDARYGEILVWKWFEPVVCVA